MLVTVSTISGIFGQFRSGIFEIRKKAVSLIGWWKDRFYGDSNLKVPTEIHIAPPSDTLTTKYSNDRVSKVKVVESKLSGSRIRVNF